MNREEKRNFKRYKSQSECEINIGTEIYKGKMVNYSDGICAIIENVLQLVPGTQGNIKISDLEMELRAEVVMVKESGNGLKVGFRRIDNFKGNLKDFRLADILTGFQRSTRTGIFQINSNSNIKKVFIKNGDIIFAVSDNNDKEIGERLLKEGKITLEEYIKASYLSIKTGERIEKYFVKLGYLTPEELSHAIKHQVEEFILNLFTIEEGQFEFHEGPFPEAEEMNLRFSAASVIYKGIKRINNLEYLKQLSPPIDAVLNFSSDPLNIFQDVTLEDIDKKILSYINGLYPIKIILMFSPSNDFETLKTLCAFLSMGLIKVKSEDEEPLELPEGVFSEPPEKLTTQFIQKIEEVYNKCETLGYYDILGVEKEASTGEIKKAFYRVSKQFHPDRHFDLPVKETNIKKKLIKILSYITDAYEILSNPEKRKEYDKTLSLEKEKLKEEPASEPSVSEEEAESEKMKKTAEEVYTERAVRSELPGDKDAGVTDKVPSDAEKHIVAEGEIVKKEKTPETVYEQTTVIEAAGINEMKDKEQSQRKIRWLIISVIIIIAIAVGVISFVVYKNIKKVPRRSTPFVTKERLPLPPFRNDLFDKELHKLSEQK